MNVKRGKICLILPGLDAGGIENYVLRYLHYAKDVSGITVLSRSSLQGDLYEKYRQTGVDLHQQKVSYLNPFKWFLLFSFFKDKGFDTVCDFNENFAGIPMLMGALAGTGRRIAFYRRSSHAFNPTWYRMVYARGMNFLVYTYSTTILSNSRSALDFFFGELKSKAPKLRVIPNGIDASVFNLQKDMHLLRNPAGFPKSCFIVGHSGRYDPAKNHETWFKVAEKLSRKYSNIRFVFCGKGTDSEVFLSKLKEYGIADLTDALGLVEDVPAVLSRMDLFYFPSVTEGQPNALLEAILSGLPVVTSGISPIKEMMPEALQHLLLDPSDVDSAVERIETYYKQGADYDVAALTVWAREQFDFDKNFKKFHDELG